MLMLFMSTLGFCYLVAALSADDNIKRYFGITIANIWFASSLILWGIQ